jgi:TonB family protein
VRVLNSFVAVFVALPAISVYSMMFPGDLKSADRQTGDEEGVTALMCAARDGERKNAKVLLEQGADVKARDTSGWTALTYAAAMGDLEIVKALLSKGANIDPEDPGDYTPLMAAVAYGNFKVVKILIEKGAEVNRRDRSGVTAMSTASRGHQDKVVEILKMAGAIEQERHEDSDPVRSKDTAGTRPVAVDTRPVLLNNPQPSYTIKARTEGIEGTVRARVLIGSDGRVKRVRILTGLRDGLSYEAMDAAYRMIFKPATKNGQPVAYWRAVEIQFRLRA